jgi:hypothetical protein
MPGGVKPPRRVYGPGEGHATVRNKRIRQLQQAETCVLSCIRTTDCGELDSRRLPGELRSRELAIQNHTYNLCEMAQKHVCS